MAEPGGQYWKRRAAPDVPDSEKSNHAIVKKKSKKLQSSNHILYCFTEINAIQKNSKTEVVKVYNFEKTAQNHLQTVKTFGINIL